MESRPTSVLEFRLVTQILANLLNFLAYLTQVEFVTWATYSSAVKDLAPIYFPAGWYGLQDRETIPASFPTSQLNTSQFLECYC